MRVEIAPSLKPTGTEMVRFHPWWNRKLQSLLHRAFGEIIHRVTVLDRTENASWLFRLPELAFLEEHCAPSRRSRKELGVIDGFSAMGTLPQLPVGTTSACWPSPITAVTPEPSNVHPPLAHRAACGTTENSV
jgi:hypothetical protein